jgi:hypothetical protein
VIDQRSLSFTEMARLHFYNAVIIILNAELVGLPEAFTWPGSWISSPSLPKIDR